MASRAVELVAGIIDRLEDRPLGMGRPPMPTIKVVATLRFFVREGVQWRELRATAGRACGAPLRRRPDGGSAPALLRRAPAARACGSALRRRLDGWSATALLRQVHAALIRMVRSGPELAPWDVVVDSCSVRAKRGGDLTGPNPTDRGKAGTKYHVVVSTDGLPLGVVPSAANAHDTRLFPHPRAPSPPAWARPGPTPASWSRPTASRWAWSPRPPTSTTRGSSRISWAWPGSSAPPSAGRARRRPAGG